MKVKKKVFHSVGGEILNKLNVKLNVNTENIYKTAKINVNN